MENLSRLYKSRTDTYVRMKGPKCKSLPPGLALETRTNYREIIDATVPGR